MWWRAVSVFVPVLVLACSLACSCVRAANHHDLYAFGASAHDERLETGEDIASLEIQLNTPIVFYGETYNSIYVNNNGLLSFRTQVESFLNVEFPLTYPVIAAFYTHVDTTASGAVFYREASDDISLSRASQSVQNAFPEYNDFQPTSVFVATWSDVGYHVLGADKVNTFQIAVITDGSESFVELLYPENGIQWIQSEPQEIGLPDARAQAGFVAEDGRSLTLKGSGSEQIRNIVLWSNCGKPGQYMFRIGKISVDGNIKKPELFENEIYDDDDSQTCAEASQTFCAVKAQCVDFETGICCQCDDGYYGNGKSCLKNDIPLRVTGKVSGEINGITFDSIDLQAYVVMLDGRTYTALSNVSPGLGYDLQTLNILGGALGWLFAKPASGVKNGYQLTGGIVNHTSVITFPAYDNSVTIRQWFTGHDVFDHLQMEVDIKGNLPFIAPNCIINLPEYTEQYSRPEPGLVLSESTRIFRNRNDSTEYKQIIKQSFHFNPCKHAPFDEDRAPVTLKVAKTFISYESKEGIVRYGMSNRVAPLGQEDPCTIGRQSCVDKSTCIVEDDSFRCICIPGYEYSYQNALAVCVDIDECAIQTHTCDPHAKCTNYEGTFSCECNEGYKGNGETCIADSGCSRISCDSNARCYETFGEPHCTCNEGFTGDGSYCWLLSEATCEVLQNCSPYAECSISPYTEAYACQCGDGYTGDGYVCTQNGVAADLLIDEKDADSSQSTVITPSCIFNECSCPSGYIMSDEQDACFREEYTTTTLPEEYNECDAVTCHTYATCEWSASGEGYGCTCIDGYHGDGHNCEEAPASASDLEVDLEPIASVPCEHGDECDVHARCLYERDLSTRSCVCDSGYKGDGAVCTPEADCEQNSECDAKAECRPNDDTNRYECICIQGYVKDNNDACIPEGGTCNNAKCVVNANCQWDNDHGLNYCQCDPGFDGDGVTECKPIKTECNIANDCSPNGFCQLDYSQELYECVCREGYTGDGYECSIIATCQNQPHMCSPRATCVRRHGSFVCECNPGFDGNGTVCVPPRRHEGDFLLIAQNMAVLRGPLSPTTRTRDVGRVIQFSPDQMAIGLDVDCLAGRVYWSDISSKIIKSANYMGLMLENFLTEDINSPEGISIDWMSRNIYWTDSRRDTIEVASLDTRIRKVLVNSGLVNPRGIAVHPSRGKIFWSDWNRNAPKIEWANMDGSGRSIFLKGDLVALPNSLSIDWETDSLCYADAGTKKIQCVHIDTLQQQTIADNCTYPFGLAVTNTHYYWTDWSTQNIEVVEKRTLQRQKSLAVPLGGTGKLYGTAYVPNECLRLPSPCQHNNGDCPDGQLCLPNGNGGRSCL